MEQELLEYFLKWFIPFACAGLFGLIVTPLVKNYQAGRKLKAKEEWNAQATELKDLLQQVISEHKELRGYISTVEQASSAEDAILDQQLQSTKDTLIDEIKTRTAGMREALLAIHLHNLIGDSMKYIEQGWVSTNDLQNYNERYITYKELGGNGHMDPWYPKVKRLPNLPPDE